MQGRSYALQSRFCWFCSPDTGQAWISRFSGFSALPEPIYREIQSEQRKIRAPTFFQFHLRIIEILVIISSLPAYNFSEYMFTNLWLSDMNFIN